MTKPLTVKENLDNARKKAHVTQAKNGQFKKMAKKRWENKGKK